MEKWVVKSLELLVKLSFLGKKYPAVLPYTPQKLEVSGYEPRYFRRAHPEKHGVKNGLLYAMLDELEKETRANIHNLLVVKDGVVISECSAPGHDVHISHLAHSMSKSLTGMAIGFLFDDGHINLDREVYKFFPEYEPKDKNFKKITVRHLLTMQSGVAFSEPGSVSESNWTRAFIESKVKFEPGTMLAYNSMNSYMLAHIAVKVSGMSLSNLLQTRLFAPLGISNYQWELGPEGIEKGGWGAYLSTESWAKIGLMMLDGGMFEGRRILSEEWVRESTKSHALASEKTGDFNYGYQLWVGKSKDEFLFNGMLGQNVWICPKNRIVVSTNAENNELFQKSPALEIIQKYLGGDLEGVEFDTGVTLSELCTKEIEFFECRRWITPRSAHKGISYRLGFKNPTPFPSEWESVLGKYSFADNNQGILPLFVRVMQNNYSGGIDSFQFERRHSSLYLTVCEGGKDMTFELGVYDYATTVLDFAGEKYITRALCSATSDEKGERLYRIELIFPEMPNSRRITMRFLKNGALDVRMEEIPNHKIAEPFVEGLYTMNPKLSFLIGIVEKRVGDKFVARKLEKTFSPRLVGVNVESSDYHLQLYNATEESEAESRSAETFASLIIQMSDDED